QDIKRSRFYGADKAGAAAMRAGLGRRLGKRRAQPLARHLQEAKRADAADLDAGAVVFQRLLQATLDGELVTPFLHVDKADDDEPGEVAQPELRGNLVGRLKVGAQRGLFDVALARRAARVDIDRDQRLGLVDDDVAARTQLRDRRVDRVDLALDLEAMEE